MKAYFPQGQRRDGFLSKEYLMKYLPFDEVQLCGVRLVRTDQEDVLPLRHR